MQDKQPAADRVWHRYAPGASDVRLVTASFRTHRFVPHAHSEYAIAVIGRGAEAVRYRGADEYTGAGSLLLLDAEAIHAAATLRPERLSLTCIRQSWRMPNHRLDTHRFGWPGPACQLAWWVQDAVPGGVAVGGKHRQRYACPAEAR